MMHIYARLCLLVGLSQASGPVHRGPHSELGIGSFSGFDIQQRPNNQLINSNSETNKYFVRIGNIGSVERGLNIYHISDNSAFRREFSVSENKSFGLNINTISNLGNTSASVHQESTSIFNNSAHTSAAVQLGISNSVGGSHESTHIKNIKTTLNGNKKKLVVLLSSKSIAVSSHNYTNNIQKDIFSPSHTGVTGSESAVSSNVNKNGYTSNFNTGNGNFGYNINNVEYQHVGSKKNNQDITDGAVIGNREQQYATSGSSDINKATRIPLEERPHHYSTSRYDGIDNGRNFNIHNGENRNVGRYDESGITIGSNYNSGIVKNVGNHFRNSENGNTNSGHTSGKSEYEIYSGNSMDAKRLSSVFVPNKSLEKHVIPITGHWDADKNLDSQQILREIRKDNYMNSGIIKNYRDSGGSQCHDEYFITNKNPGNQKANSRVQRIYKSNYEGQGTHLGDSESRVGQWIVDSEKNRDYGLKSISRVNEGVGSHQVVSKTYNINSLNEHNPSQWSSNVEHKKQFTGKNYWDENGGYRRNMANTQRQQNYSGTSEMHNRRDFDSSELHEKQSSGNVASRIYLKDTDNHGVNWSNRKMYSEKEGRENDWEYSNHRYGVTASNVNRHDNNAYIQTIGHMHANYNQGNVYENNNSGGELPPDYDYGLNLPSRGRNSNIASYPPNNDGDKNNWQYGGRQSTDSRNNYDHSSLKAGIDKEYYDQRSTHEHPPPRNNIYSAGDESYRRHLIGHEYNNRNIGDKLGRQVYSTSHPISNDNHRSHIDHISNSRGHEKYLTDARVYGSSSDNIGVFTRIPGSSNKQHASQSIINNDRENQKVADDNYGHHSIFNKNHENYWSDSDSHGISFIGNKDQGNYWGSIGLYGSHSSTNQGYKHNWEGYEAQQRHFGGSGRYASQWNGSVGYINQWNITGNHESHSSGSAVYASHWADSTGQKSHSTSSVGYISHWGTSGEKRKAFIYR